MILYRLVEDCHWLNLLEGSCIIEERFEAVYFTDKALFEPIQEYEKKDMIVYDESRYCILKSIECMLFYTNNEYEKFLKKI